MQVRRVVRQDRGIRAWRVVQSVDCVAVGRGEPAAGGWRSRSGGSQTASSQSSNAAVSGTPTQYPATPASSLHDPGHGASGKAR